ncbi:MAG: hypothetical protein QXR13_01910, partial [Candidatus Bathyarchaeia archaeon]
MKLGSTSVDLSAVRNLAKKIALLNAVSYGGKAQSKPVLGKLLGERPDLRPFAKMIVAIVEGVIQEVNSLSQG